MMPILLILLTVFISTRPTAAGGTASILGSEPPPIHQFHIHHSHLFHVEPRAIINSVISDVRRRPLIQHDDGGKSLLDIDVSSTLLGDAAAVSMLEELLPLLESKVDKTDDSQATTNRPLLIKLTLAMNKITPVGASNILNILTKREGDKDGEVIQETTNGTLTIENADVMNKTNELNIESDNGANDEQSAINTTADETSSTDPSQDATKLDIQEPAVLIEELDLSLNDIGGHGMHPPNVKLLESVRRLFEGGGAAPKVLSLESCGIGPAFCRSIGRGILNGFERINGGETNMSCRPTVLRLGGNNAIGDAGSVALAAALRMAVENGSDSHQVLDELDMSSCDVGDAGAEALALALASNPGCLCKLDLSNNKITDAGCKALGRALVDAAATSSTIFEKIIIDNNDIGDDGATALAEALACGAVRSISMRSCHLKAQATAAFGKAVVSVANRKNGDKSKTFHVDLSGNHFGTRKLKKKKGYSASAIRDKASTNIKFIGKTLRGAAKRFSSETMGLTADSDDDEEVMGGLIDDGAQEIDDNKIQACGGHSFSGEILRADQQPQSQKNDTYSIPKIHIAMRQCCLDDGAIDALSASIVGLKNCVMSVDVSMNTVDDDIVDALMHKVKDSKLLESMAERHLDLLDRIADARQRQLDAAETAQGMFFGDDDDEDLFDVDFDYDPSDDFD